MLRFLNPFIEKRVAKSFASISHVELQNNLSSKRPNNALQSYLKSNPSKTFLLFSDLLRRNTSLLDSYSLLYAIKACTKKAGAIEGKQVHTLVLKLGYEPIIFLQTSLVNMYSAAGNLADARRMFEEMPTRNVICWTSLVSAYVDNQEANAALEMFRRMQKENVKPDHVTLTVALSACADLGALEMGEWIHGYITQKSELNADLYLKNALINMYVKCGDIGRAKELFDNLKRKDVTSWTSMIVGYAVHGQAEDALRLYAAMEKESKSMTNKKCSHKAHLIIPNDVTFVGVLMACSHAGMLEEGKKYFRIMTEEFGLKPRLPHYGCMVDLFCRKGMLKDANEFILAMLVEPNAIIWRTLLGACTIHGNLDLAAEAYNKLLQLEESVVGDDVLMSNIYAAKEMWNEKLKVRDEIKQRRTPGHSTIEVGSCIYEFVSADDHHPLAVIRGSGLYRFCSMALGHDETWPSSSHGQACLSSGHARSRSRRKKDTGLMIAFCYLVRLMATAIFTALTILFAVAGAFTGGIAGGIAGWVSNTGILRGVAMVAIAGATISVQFLDALRTYWCSECPGSSSSSSMANFLQELFDTIFVNQQIEQFPPATPRSHQLQVNRPNTSYGESRAGPSVVASSGLSEDSLKKLPCLVLLDEMKAEQEACCSICLQDVGVGDTARTLPQCRHMFHLACVDKWLVIHGSCPVCRQDVTNYP